MTTNQQDGIEWRDGIVPVSTRFNDPYFSVDDGLAETRHVYLAGNGLPARFEPGFRIAELGVGTGLNMLAALSAWQQSSVGGSLHYTGFEAFPMTCDQMHKALSVFPDMAKLAAPLLAVWDDTAPHIETPDLIADFVIGDARQTLPSWQGCADAWFLDGFAPARNPEMWEDALMHQVARHTAPGGSFATYTAAGQVRRALQQGGFTVTRHPGYGRKRHMTSGWLTA